MTSIEQPSDLGTSTAQSGALEACGGFEAYQALIRSNIIEKAKDLTVQQLVTIDEKLRALGADGGLKQGVYGIVSGTSHEPLTNDNIEMLELLLGFARTALFSAKVEPHLTIGKQGDPMGLIIDKSGDGLDRRTAEFLLMFTTIFQASDDEIARRQAAEPAASAQAG